MAIDYAEKKKPFREQVFDLLSDLKWHTHVELSRVGGNRYAARILELKRQGYQIDSKPFVDVGKVYRLVSLKRGEPQSKRVRVFLDIDDAILVVNCSHLPDNIRDIVQESIDSFLNRGEAL